MSKPPLYVALIWHMHQPYYKDLVTGEYVLPWVRLHGAKDYYDMVAILDDFPEIRATFNMVPSLLIQIEEYVNSRVNDKYLALSEKDPAGLTKAEKVFILQNFFMCNWDTMVKPYKRYYDLLFKRGRFPTASELESLADRMRTQDLMDLQVWFNLAWFGFIYKKHDPIVKEMVQKGQGFTPEDKAKVLAKQKEILSRIIPKYKEVAARGQIELTTTPFYHPILPLLCDTNAAKEALPNIKLPQNRFRHPEDAREQIKRAVAFHAQRFGQKPVGMWPSEGSVSEEMLPLAAQNGIQWIATDQAILEHSLGKFKLGPGELYQPYYAQKDGQKIAMVYRNHFLSDQIGFVYQKWAPRDGACDFISHLNNIRNSLPHDGRKYLVCIILDGENAWEYYPDLGEPFLRELYGALSDNPCIKTTTVSDFINENPPRHTLPRLFAGSWINHNFRIWIGHDEDNRAWDHLNAARMALEGVTVEQNFAAWEELYIAEGSDWCWWYGDDHSSENDEVFDSLFRKHLKNIYTLLKKEPPPELLKPVKQLKEFQPTKQPVQLITPALDGLVTTYYEWLPAGNFNVEKTKGAMHQLETILEQFYYGFDMHNLYCMIKTNLDLALPENQGLSFGLLTYYPQTLKAMVSNRKFELFRLESGQLIKLKELNTFAAQKVIEFGMLFADLGVSAGEPLDFAIVVEKDSKELERWPRGGMINIKVPSEGFELENWSV